MYKSKNFASADAQVEVTEMSINENTDTTTQRNHTSKDSKSHSSPNKRKQPTSFHSSSNTSKRPRFRGPAAKRRGGASYQKEPLTTSLLIVPRISNFPVFTSNIGCQLLSEVVFQAIRGKDFRLAQNITQVQLCYVLVIAFCNRVVQTALKYGYAFPGDASRLKQIASGIQLPDLLAKYIESIGQYSLLSTARLVPWAASYRTLFPPACQIMIDPAELLVEAGRPIPPGDWALDTEWIIAYNEATTRASRSGMKFRMVDNSEFLGRIEMVVSYMPVAEDMLLPKAPQVMTEAEAQLGACYKFRNYQEIDVWFGMHKELLFDAFTAIPFDPRVVISDAAVAAFSGSEITTA